MKKKGEKRENKTKQKTENRKQKTDKLCKDTVASMLAIQVSASNKRTQEKSRRRTACERIKISRLEKLRGTLFLNVQSTQQAESLFRDAYTMAMDEIFSHACHRPF